MKHCWKLSVVALFVFVGMSADAIAQNQIAVKETIRTPVSSIEMRERKETVYTPKYTTKMVDQQQVLLQPVTRWTYVPRTHNVLNPFAPTYTAWHLTPQTSWEPRVIKTQAPVTTVEYDTTTRVVKEPTRVLKMVEREQTRMVAQAPTVSQNAIARHVPGVRPPGAPLPSILVQQPLTTPRFIATAPAPSDRIRGVHVASGSGLSIGPNSSMNGAPRIGLRPSSPSGLLR